MTKKWAQVLAITLFAATTAMCSKNDLEDETQDVIEEQQEASEAATENPSDTARIREEANEVVEEQREAAEAMREEVKDKGLDTVRTTTRQ